MKAGEVQKLINEFPDLTWEEILEVHEFRNRDRIAEQRKKLAEARSHPFEAPYGGTQVEGDPYTAVANECLRRRVTSEQAANENLRKQLTREQDRTVKLRGMVNKQEFLLRALVDEFPDATVDHPTYQKSDWKTFAGKLQAARDSLTNGL